MTIQTATPTELTLIADNPRTALQAAVDMLNAIQNGHSYDTADYLLRKAAIVKALDAAELEARMSWYADDEDEGCDDCGALSSDGCTCDQPAEIGG